MKSNAEILKELYAQAKTQLPETGDMGYTMPDRKHHIIIYKDQEDSWDEAPPEQFYVIEPNRVVNGVHDPMGDTYLTSSTDLAEVLIGCQWCLDVFEHDRQRELPDELTVRLAHEAGWMEAEGKIEVHSWEDIQIAVRDAITNYYENPNEQNPFVIEEILEKILLDRFPSEKQKEPLAPSLDANNTNKPSLSSQIQEAAKKSCEAEKSNERLSQKAEIRI